MQSSPSELSPHVGLGPSLQRGSPLVNHLIVGVGLHLLLVVNLLPVIYKSGNVLCIPVGLAFGHLTMAALWLAMGRAWERIPLSVGIVIVEVLVVWLLISTYAQWKMEAVFAILIVCVVASTAYILLTTGMILVVRKLSGIALIHEWSGYQASKEIRIQYGTKDLLIAMLVVSFAASIFQWVAKTESGPKIAMATFVFFGLLCSFYYILAWPILVACLSRNGVRISALIAFVICLLVSFLEPRVFFRLTKIGGMDYPLLFFALWNIPMVLSVLFHALLVRASGYRLWRVKQPRQENLALK